MGIKSDVRGTAPMVSHWLRLLKYCNQNQFTHVVANGLPLFVPEPFNFRHAYTIVMENRQLDAVLWD